VSLLPSGCRFERPQTAAHSVCEILARKYRGALIAQMAARSVRLKFAKLGKLMEAKRSAAGAQQ
jgi:hypothetical protein